MKIFFVSICIFTFLLFQISCTESASENKNISSTPNVSNTNSNSNLAVSTPTPVAEKTPLPTFTDAVQALEEGKKLLNLSKNDEAIEVFKQAVKLNPDLAEAHFQLGVAYALVETEKESQVEIPDPKASPTPKKGKPVEEKLNSEKSFENAVKAYKKILSKNPKDDSALFNLARCYNKLNDDKEAEKTIRQAIKLKPNDSEYQAELGAIMIKFAKYEEAVNILKKALKIDETNSRAEVLLEKAEAGKKREDYAKPKEAPKPKK